MTSHKSASANALNYFFIFMLLIITTILTDLVLHWMKLVWIGRYFGLFGTVLILLSLSYSLRKHKIINSGGLKNHLQFHEFTSWLGSLLILVHAGIHFNAILPWVALIAMLVNVGSGLTGKYLQSKSMILLNIKKAELSEYGLSKDEFDKIIFLDSLTVDIIKKWRAVHIPITVAFALLAVSHIVMILKYIGRF